MAGKFHIITKSFQKIVIYNQMKNEDIHNIYPSFVYTIFAYS